MSTGNRRARINVKVLTILVATFVLLGAAAFVARHIRRRVLSARALVAGRASFGNQDWAAASEHLKEYLSRNPDDVEILRMFAEASLSVRPMETRNLRTAIWAYRRLLRLDPTDRQPYERLARLYSGLGNFGELAYVAKRRVEYDPNDTQAPVWLGEALMGLRRPEEASVVLKELVAKLGPLPEKHPGYVQACGLMARIAFGTGESGVTAGSSEARGSEDRAGEWLNRAVDYDPGSVGALARRARFYRLATAVGGLTAQERLAAARADLERADELRTTDPRIRVFLSREWMEHGEFGRAAAELDAVKSLDESTLKEYFFDPHDWVVERFLQAAELALRSKQEAAGAALADEALGTLRDKRHRIKVLPQAVHLYLAAQRASDGRARLQEYIDALHSQGTRPRSLGNVAHLRALVARAEDQLYQVIDCLEPAVVADPSSPELWRLLAEAYSRTDQTRRAVRALIRYLRLRPRDPEMTLQLAKEYLKLQDWNRAFETARLAAPLDPADIIIRLLQIEASIYLAVESHHQVDKARLKALDEELAMLRKQHSRRVDIRILQAIIADYQDRPADAERELKLAIEECGDPLRAEMQLTRHYFRLRRPADAMKVCRAACARHPKEAEPWLSLSGLHVAQGHYDEAISALRSGREKVVGRWEERAVAIRMALVEILHGDRGKGIGLLKELATRDSQELRARSLLLGLREVRADRAAASGLIREMREVEGESGLLWRLYQAALWLSGDDWRSRQQDIAEAVQRCIDSDPDWSAPALLLVDLYERLGDDAHAEEACRQALSRNPSATDVADRLVRLLEKQKRYSEAQDVVKSLDRKSRTRSAWYVRLALRQGDLSRAIDELKLRASNDDRDATSRILLARLVYWQTRDFDHAVTYLREAETIAPQAMALAEAKVMILRLENRQAEARAVLDEQVGKSGSFAAYLMRAAYLRMVEQLDLAEKDYTKLTTFPEAGGQGYALLADFYAQTGSLDKTIDALQKGERTYPKDLSLQRNLMRALFERGAEGDRHRAIEILASLEKQLPGDPGLMRVRAMQVERGATPESIRQARQTLEQTVRLEPTSVEAYVALIDLTMQQGDYEAARRFAGRALGTNRENIQLTLALARAERKLNNPRMAAELAQMVLRKQPDNAEARGVLVEAALFVGDRGLLREARQQTAGAIARKPDDERLQLNQARLLTALGENGTAITKLEAYCQSEKGSRSAEAVLMLAELYRARGDMEKSGERIRQAIRLAPKDPAIVPARVRWLATQGKFDEILAVIEEYRAGGSADPAVLAAAASDLAFSSSKRHLKEALRLYEGLVGAAGDEYVRTEAHLGLASVAYRMGQADRARKIYLDVLTQDPENARALNDLAWVLADHYQDYEAALGYADKGKALAPDSPHLLDTRGVILTRLGRLKDAREDFEKILEMSGVDDKMRARALLGLGRACTKLEDAEATAAAKRHLKEALDIDARSAVFDPNERSEIQRLLQGGAGKGG